MTIDIPRPEGMGDTISWLFDFWLSKFDGDRCPAKHDMDALELGTLNPSILRQLCLYDVERDPYRFRYRLVGGAIPDAGGFAKRGLYIDDVEPSGQVDAALIKTCETGVPWYKTGPSMIAHRTNIAAIEALTVPLNGETDRIDFLMSCSVYHWEKGFSPTSSLGVAPC